MNMTNLTTMTRAGTVIIQKKVKLKKKKIGVIEMLFFFFFNV